MKKLLFVLLVLAACSKEEEDPQKNQPVLNADVCAIKQLDVISEYDPGEVTQDQFLFTLDNENKPVSAKFVYKRADNSVDVSDVTYIYDGDGRLVRIVEETESDWGDYDVLITYADDRIKTITHNGSMDFEYAYTYNANGQMTKKVTKTGDVGTGQSVLSSEYLYNSASAKNPYLIKNDDGTSVEVTYDDKRSFWNAINLLSGYHEPGENNLVKEVFKEADGSIDRTNTYEYEYNEEGYVTRLFFKEIRNANAFSETYEVDVVYSCK